MTPLPAASVIVLRDAPLEVLLLRRSAKSSFVPDAWVFPGGIAEEEDLRETAVRETFEEAGLQLDASQLVPTSRWITPVGIPKRFDTLFFLAVVPRDAQVTVDGNEIVDSMWIAPADALARRDLKLVFPTIKNLEAIANFTRADELLAARRGAIIEPVQPVLVDGRPRIL
ncbi:MAG TPA: NUDIX hydrolase [Thermoanaerobaculia bacterium]|nr:NUDIX hydrolase [Thermoanaerobaculia bacterium]